MSSSFMYNLGVKIRLLDTEELGTVVGRAEYSSSENSYYIRYKAADGRQVISWWGESHITDV